MADEAPLVGEQCGGVLRNVLAERVDRGPDLGQRVERGQRLEVLFGDGAQLQACRLHGCERSAPASRPPALRAPRPPGPSLALSLTPRTQNGPPEGRPVPTHITGGVLLSRALAGQVPSALRGLTALFGMGRGVSPSP